MGCSIREGVGQGGGFQSRCGGVARSGRRGDTARAPRSREGGGTRRGLPRGMGKEPASAPRTVNKVGLPAGSSAVGGLLCPGEGVGSGVGSLVWEGVRLPAGAVGGWLCPWHCRWVLSEVARKTESSKKLSGSS